jgi:hypothetical protein
MTAQDDRHDPAFGRPVASDKIDVQLGADSVDAWARTLEGRWPFEGPTALPWGQRWIQLRDPDGLLVAIYEGLDPGRQTKSASGAPSIRARSREPKGKSKAMRAPST